MTSGAPNSRALVDIIEGRVAAVVDIAVPPERVFRALASSEIVNWWVNPGIFDTREWSGDVRVGGRWQASGMARGAPYVLEGVFLEVDPPRRLTHTWHIVGEAAAPSTVTYELEATAAGTRLRLSHTGLPLPEVGKGAAGGWESSLHRLVVWLGHWEAS